MLFVTDKEIGQFFGRCARLARVPIESDGREKFDGYEQLVDAFCDAFDACSGDGVVELIFGDDDLASDGTESKHAAFLIALHGPTTSLAAIDSDIRRLLGSRQHADEVGLAFVSIAEPGVTLLAFYPASLAQRQERERSRDVKYEHDLALLDKEVDLVVEETEKALAASEERVRQIQARAKARCEGLTRQGRDALVHLGWRGRTSHPPFASHALTSWLNRAVVPQVRCCGPATSVAA